LFSTKYGQSLGTAYLARIHLVLRFLAVWKIDVGESGLAGEVPFFAIREELVDYLLMYKLQGDETETPKCALPRFLYEWGHRWF
jgi:hypothetical protein